MISSVPRSQIPKATSISYLFRTLGSTLGVAICSSFQQAILGRELRRRIVEDDSEHVGFFLPSFYLFFLDHIHLTTVIFPPPSKKKKKIIQSIIHSKAYLQTLPLALKAEAIAAYSISLRTTFLLTAVFGVFAFLAAIPIEEHHLGEKHGPVGGGKRVAEGEVGRDGERRRALESTA